MHEPGDDLDPIERMADSFVARFRAGERPSVEEYASRYPELADEIRELLPALVMIEQNISIGGESLYGPTGRAAPFAGGVPSTLGDYRILRELGRGGMGVVYEAVQQSLGRHVALKVLAWQNVHDAAHLERFGLEARAAARLHHTNIVPVFGVGEHQGTHYYAMQFIQGQGLDAVYHELRRLRNGRPALGEPARQGHGQGQGGRFAATLARSLATDQFGAEEDASGAAPAPLEPAAGPAAPPSSCVGPASAVLTAPLESTASGDRPYFQGVARIGLQVAEALAYAHGQGIVHRDIKPSNLLLDDRGTVWVTDFGLAKADGSDGPTQPGDIIGTLRYMAPERFDGRSDPRSDLYALGATLYELLTLRPLFDESTRARLIERVLRDDPTPPRRLATGVPRDLETIVLKALAKEPQSRYASARAMADDLRRFLDDQPIAARRVGALERAWRLCRRNPAVSGLAAAVAALLVVVAAGASLAAARERTARLAAERSQSELQRAWREYEHARSAVESLRRTIGGQRSTYEAAPTEAARQTLDTLYQRLAAELRDARRPADAAAAAWERQALWPGDPDRLVDVARDVARSLEPGRSLPWVADQAMGLLVRATLAGPVAPAGLANDPVFAPLRERGDFRDLAAAPREPAIGQAVVRRYEGHTHAFVEDVAIMADGRHVLSAGQDGTARLWDLGSGRELQRFLHDHGVYALALLPDGRRFATASGNTAWLWDVKSGHVLAKLDHPDQVWSVASTPDGGLLTGCDDEVIRLWDVAAGREVRRYEGVHRNQIRDLAVSPDGRGLLSGDLDGQSCHWEVKTGRLLRRLEARRGAVWCVAFTPDGRHAVTGGVDGRLILWDLATGVATRTFRGHRSWVRSVAISPDGRRAVSGGQDGALIAWDVEAGTELHRWFGPGAQVGIAMTADARYVVTADNDRVARLWLVADDVAAARDQARLGRIDAAAEAYARALEARPYEDGLAREAARFLRPLRTARRPGRALEHLAGLIPPDDLLASPAEPNRAERTAEDDDAFALDEALALRPNDPELLERRGTLYGLRRRWGEAADDFGRLALLAPDDDFHQFRATILAAAAGDEESHRRIRRGFLRRFGESGDFETLERVAKICLLLADAGPDQDAGAALAGKLAEGDCERGLLPFVLMVRGLAEYRTGDPRRAVDWLRRATRAGASDFWPVQAPAHFVLALAHHRLGQADEARAASEAAVRLLEAAASPEGQADYRRYWQDWALSSVLRREAEAQLKRPAVEPAPAEH